MNYYKIRYNPFVTRITVIVFLRHTVEKHVKRRLHPTIVPRTPVLQSFDDCIEIVAIPV